MVCNCSSCGMTLRLEDDSQLVVFRGVSVGASPLRPFGTAMPSFRNICHLEGPALADRVLQHDTVSEVTNLQYINHALSTGDTQEHPLSLCASTRQLQARPVHVSLKHARVPSRGASTSAGDTANTRCTCPCTALTISRSNHQHRRLSTPL